MLDSHRYLPANCLAAWSRSIAGRMLPQPNQGNVIPLGVDSPTSRRTPMQTIAQPIVRTVAMPFRFIHERRKAAAFSRLARWKTRPRPWMDFDDHPISSIILGCERYGYDLPEEVSLREFIRLAEQAFESRVISVNTTRVRGQVPQYVYNVFLR